jgi:hypothetical protein
MLLFLFLFVIVALSLVHAQTVTEVAPAPVGPAPTSNVVVNMNVNGYSVDFNMDNSEDATVFNTAQDFCVQYANSDLLKEYQLTDETVREKCILPVYSELVSNLNQQSRAASEVAPASDKITVTLGVNNFNVDFVLVTQNGQIEEATVQDAAQEFCGQHASSDVLKEFQLTNENIRDKCILPIFNELVQKLSNTKL